jgi:hypothetical protein
MTLRTIWAVIARWRWILIPGLLLALGGGAALFLQTPRTYTVQASYLFLSPVKDTKGIASNPFLQLGNGVSQAVDVLAVSLVDGETVRTFTKTAPKLTYTAARDLSVAAPLMVITVEDVKLQTASSTLASLGGILDQRLDALQKNAGAPQGQWITMTKLTSDPKPKIGYSDGIRNGVLGFVGALLFVFIVIGIAERIHVKRAATRARREAEAAAAAAAAAESGEEPAPELGKPKRKRRSSKLAGVTAEAPPADAEPTETEPTVSTDAEPTETEPTVSTDAEPTDATDPDPEVSGAELRASEHDDDDLDEALAEQPLNELRK